MKLQNTARLLSPGPSPVSHAKLERHWRVSWGSLSAVGWMRLSGSRSFIWQPTTKHGSSGTHHRWKLYVKFAPGFVMPRGFFLLGAPLGKSPTVSLALCCEQVGQRSRCTAQMYLTHALKQRAGASTAVTRTYGAMSASRGERTPSSSIPGFATWSPSSSTTSSRIGQSASRIRT